MYKHRKVSNIDECVSLVNEGIKHVWVSGLMREETQAIITGHPLLLNNIDFTERWFPKFPSSTFVFSWGFIRSNAIAPASCDSPWASDRRYHLTLLSGSLIFWRE